jgi:hypothetical protein
MRCTFQLHNCYPFFCLLSMPLLTNDDHLLCQVLQNAFGMYRNFNALALQVVKRGGLLMTCSSSGAMTQSGIFLKTIQVFDLPILHNLSKHVI